MGFFALIGVLLLIGGILGWVAFFRTLSLSKEIRDLRAALGAQQARHRQTSNAGEEASPIKAGPDTPPQESDLKEPAYNKVKQEPVWRQSEADRDKIEDRPAGVVEVSAAGQADPELLSADTTGAAGLEQRLAGNWLIWLGGATLTLGGAFLLKSAVDAGFFGPVMRIATALIAGAAMIGAGEWTRRTRVNLKDENKSSELWRTSIAPPVLAGAGGATIYGAIFSAFGLYDLIPSLAATILLTAACAGMVVLAVLHRAPAIAGLALIGAYLSPLITASGEPTLSALLLYVYGVSAAGLIIARIMSWRAISYVALIGGFLWPLLAITGVTTPAISLYIYLPAYFMLAAFVAWDEAGEPININQLISGGIRSFPVSLVAFYLALLGSLGLGLLVSLKFDREAATIAMWGAFGALTLVGAQRREGFSLAPIFVMLSAVLITALSSSSGVMASASVSFGLAALFALGGYAVMIQHLEKGPAACVAAFGPVLLLTAQHYQSADIIAGVLWGVMALSLVWLNVAMLADLRKRAGNMNDNPGAVSAFVAGATLASAMTAAMTFDGLMMSAALAIQAPVFAWLWQRYRLPALKYGAGALAAAASVRLLLLPEISEYAFGEWPIANMLIPGYLVPAAGFWFAARWFEKGGLGQASRVIQGLEAGAIALFAAFVSLQIRHLLNDGDISADRVSLLEVSLQTINWISIAAFLRWRFGVSLTMIRRVAELALICLATLLSFSFSLTTANPWWGPDGPDINGPPVFNLLLIAYLAPALVYGVISYVARKSDALLQSRLTGLFALLMGFAWLVLSIRHVFHAPDLSSGSIGAGESWIYSIATILYAAALLIAGAFRRGAALRYAGFGVLILAVFKVFLFDMAGLDGVWRASSFLGLGAALIGIAMLYQRLAGPDRTNPRKAE